jgi:rhodanese-related sulfurtransferase
MLTEGSAARHAATRETVRGALVIVLAGAALGAGFNALGQASHPPRGLPWVAREETLPSLEAWQASVGDSARAPAEAADSLRAAPPAPAGTAASTTRPAREEARPGATVAVPGTAGANPGSVASPPPAPPASEADSLPAVPDLDTPIQVQLATLKRFFDAGGAVIVDAREAAEYAAGHVAGALSLPYDDVAAQPARLDAVRRAEKPIIIYCSGPGCDLSRQLATTMLSEGIRKVLVFEAGFPAWQAAGYPVERGGPR